MKNKKAILLLALFFILLGIYCTHRGGSYGNDFKVHLAAARYLWHKGDLARLSAVYRFYPPLVAILLSPVCIWNPFLSAALYYVLNVFLLFLSVSLCVKIVGNGIGQTNSRLYAYPLILTGGLLLDNFILGQINLMVFFLILASLYYFKRSRKAASGWLLSLAVSVKLTPALFLPYFLYKKQYAVVVHALCGLAVFSLLVPAVFYGSRQSIVMNKKWLNYVASPGTYEPGLYRVGNQSLAAALARFFVALPYSADNYSGKKVGVNIVSMDGKAVDCVTKALCVILVMLLAFLCRTPVDGKNAFLLNFEYALVMISMLFISPMSWTHHYIVLLFPYAVLVGWLMNSKEKARKSKVKRALVISLVLSLLSVFQPVKVLSSVFFSAVIVFATLVYVYGSAFRPSPDKKA